ncbi:MAG: ATP/GTP-binding protein [Actinobacteria bacterium]|nr:ATP/GTP-binding protein [Actinomycetota bacterium]
MAGGSRRAARRAQALAALRSGDEDGASRIPAGERVEDGYVVRSVAGTASTRPYRCPGCDQELPAGVPHVVTWPQGRPDERRHWHATCWSARGRRGVKVHRSKNAPRYG